MRYNTGDTPDPVKMLVDTCCMDPAQPFQPAADHDDGDQETNGLGAAEARDSGEILD